MLKGKLRNLLIVLTAVLVGFSVLGQSSLKILIIDASEDTYVVTDLASAEDPQGFRKQNYGSLEFLKTWYAWGVLQDERLLSVDLIKFDLSELQGRDIELISLQMFARQTNLTEQARLVDVHLVNGQWSEAKVTYETRPSWNNVPVATAAIYGAGGWYTWNITGSATAAERLGEISYAVALRSATQQNEEQVLFVSKEALDKAPRMLVTYSTSPGSGIGSVDWWWWLVIVGVVVVLVLGAFTIGVRRYRSPPIARV